MTISELIAQFKTNDQHSSTAIQFPQLEAKIANPEFHNLLFDLFYANQKIPKLEIVLSMFPDVLEQFIAGNNIIMEETTILPIENRYYIAIMAVSTYGCEYLHTRLASRFIQIGGNINWLEFGSEQIPQKLKELQ